MQSVQLDFFLKKKVFGYCQKKNDCVSVAANKSFLMEVQLFFPFRPHEESVVSISQALSGSQAQLPPHQQQQHPPMVFTTTASVIDEPDNNPQLFHSTKF